MKLQFRDLISEHFIVAPYAGAWIEILFLILQVSRLLSLPTRERGLKFESMQLHKAGNCRSLRGSVD